jgi:hypothetical protein
VDDRLGRIGKNGTRMRHEIGGSFSDQDRQTENQGETHGKALIEQLLFVSPRCEAGGGLRGHALYPWIGSLALQAQWRPQNIGATSLRDATLLVDGVAPVTEYSASSGLSLFGAKTIHR